jgi:U6 snRNA-associated Sm-like protein LSm1
MTSLVKMFKAAYLANLLLQNTIERIFVGNTYADIPRGVYVVRGDNVVLLGEVVSQCNVY